MPLEMALRVLTFNPAQILVLCAKEGILNRARKPLAKGIFE